MSEEVTIAGCSKPCPLSRAIQLTPERGNRLMGGITGFAVHLPPRTITARAVTTSTTTAAVTSVASPIDSAESLLAQLNLFLNHLSNMEEIN